MKKTTYIHNYTTKKMNKNTTMKTMTNNMKNKQEKYDDIEYENDAEGIYYDYEYI